MTPFVEISVRRDSAFLQGLHEMLLSRPDSFFLEVFQGRMPSQDEKLRWTEDATKLMIPDRAFRNDTYTVLMNIERPFIHLDIRRHDAGAVTSWQEFQRIKNELVGPEHEAVELFPAESRLIDTSNQYHLWVFADPANRFPLGWQRRCVLPTGGEPSRRQTACDSAAGRAPMGVTLRGGGVAMPNIQVGLPAN